MSNPSPAEPELDSSSTDTVELSLEENPREKYYGGPPVIAVIEFGAESHVGRVRKNNEDHYAVVRRMRTREVLLTNVPRGELPSTTEEAYAYVVADGVGGAVCGELASRLALTTAWEMGPRERSWPMRADATNVADIQSRMQTLIDIIAESFQRRARENPELHGMGTTFTAIYSVGRDAFVGHLGDSRAYLIRDGKIGLLTHDDTLAQFLIESGAKPERVAKLHHILTNCLTTDGSPATVMTVHLQLREGDRLLLCSDGLTNHLADNEILEVVSAGSSCTDTCAQLIQAALERGGKDNVTVVLARYQFQEPKPESKTG